jgi:hypothetical protein
MDRNQQSGIGLPVQPRYERICFEKEHVADSPRAELVSPGHPLLEACISLVMERVGAVLGQGAVLVDERDLGREPRLLFCLEHGLQDGRKTRSGQQQLISNRLQFLEISRGGDVNPAPARPPTWTTAPCGRRSSPWWRRCCRRAGWRRTGMRWCSSTP